MYQGVRDQLEKTKIIITGIKKNRRLGRNAGVTDLELSKMEEDCKRLEALSADLEKVQEEARVISEKTHEVLEGLKKKTKNAKRAIKTNYDQTWWIKFGITDKK